MALDLSGREFEFLIRQIEVGNVALFMGGRLFRRRKK
jgi:hypothetical protein